jgi:hypothetical protein
MKRVLHVFVSRKSDLCWEKMSNTAQGIELLGVAHFSSLNRHISVRAVQAPLWMAARRGDTVNP